MWAVPSVSLSPDPPRGGLLSSLTERHRAAGMGGGLRPCQHLFRSEDPIFPLLECHTRFLSQLSALGTPHPAPHPGGVSSLPGTPPLSSSFVLCPL